MLLLHLILPCPLPSMPASLSLSHTLSFSVTHRYLQHRVEESRVPNRMATMPDTALHAWRLHSTRAIEARPLSSNDA